MTLPITEIKPNPDNPRFIKDDNFKKLVQSIKDFPEMLDARPLVLNKDNIILGGNMRYKAAIDAGLTELPVKIVDWPEDKQREFIIKDNVSGGDWDWDILANEWDTDLLDDWGLPLPNYEEPPIDLPDGEKDGFQQMTFTVADQQADMIKEALKNAKSLITGDEVNENSNGNALFYIAKDFNERS